MTAHVKEVVIRSFRVRPEALRDLDAILRQRLSDFDPQITPRYIIRRKDNYSFETQSIESVLSERNGVETAITSLVVAVSHANELQLTIDFSDGVVMTGRAEDRAKFLALTTDVRTLIREGMTGRSSRLVDDYSRWWIPYIVGMIVLFGAQGLSATLFDISSNRHDAAVAEWRLRVEQYEASTEAIDKEVEALEDQHLREAQQLSRSGSTDQQIRFLVRKVADELALQQKKDAVGGEYPEYPDYPDRPWWQNSILVVFGLAGAAWLITYLILRYVGRKPEAVFLVGDGVGRQERSDRRKEQIVWGIGVALVLGVVSSVIAARFFGA